MIYGNLSLRQHEKSCFAQSFSRILVFLEGRDAAALAPGKYNIEGEDIFALVQESETEPQEKRKFELHNEYIDIQLLLEGEEKQLYAPAPEAGGNADLLEDRLEESDIAFYSTPPAYDQVILQPGEYAVYMPRELHCPCCAPAGSGGKIRKIVFKIRREAQ
jgi:YhcH/YjgK/YiaL family protein